MNEPSPERTCANCDGFSPKSGDDHWHIRRDVPLALSFVLFSLAMAIGGWVWLLSGQASAVVDTDRRVSALELRQGTIDRDMRDLSAKIGQIDGKLDILVSRAK